MTIKAIMVDVDGVLVVHPEVAGWSLHLQRDLGVSAEDLHREFFDVHWCDIICGRANIRERLAPVLKNLCPNITSDRLIEYWFSHDAHVSLALLNELDMLRSKGLEIHLATVQEHERARFLWNDLGLRNHCDGLHYAADIGYAKPDVMFFELITRRTGFVPEEIFFIDDRIENVEGARQAGWRAAHWTPDANLGELLTAQAIPNEARS